MKQFLLPIIVLFPLVVSGCQAPMPEVKTIELYYYNPVKDHDANGNILCSKAGLQPVERQINDSQDYIKDTILLLLSGQLTSQERAAGLSTEYPLEDFNLENSTLNNGRLTLEFSDPGNKTSGGSCRVSILWAQIEATAKQFSEVKEVQFKPEELFQP